MEPSPAARPQPLRELPHGQAQNDRQTTDNASSEPCYIDDVTTAVAEKVTAATVVDRLETTTTAVTAVDDNNSTAMRAVDENNLTAVTAADEEVTASAAPATLQITTDEKEVTVAARVSEVSFVRKFKRFLIFFINTDLIRRHTRMCYLYLTNGLHGQF